MSETKFVKDYSSDEFGPMTDNKHTPRENALLELLERYYVGECKCHGDRYCAICSDTNAAIIAAKGKTQEETDDV